MKKYLPLYIKTFLSVSVGSLVILLVPFLSAIVDTSDAKTNNYKKQAMASIAGNGNGLVGTYYNNRDFSGTTITRIDQKIHFDWGTTAPDPAIRSNTYSVRWSGQILPKYSEMYTFYTIADDGVRLWVNNKLLIDNWTDQAPTENRGSIQLTAGQKVAIKMEFYENRGNATAQLFWSSPSTPKQIVPQSQLFAEISPDIQLAASNPTPSPTPQPQTTPILSTDPPSNTVTSFITFYGWADNTPPGNAIAYPGFPNTIHTAAGGTGTYADPITMASDPNVWPIGTRFYVPYLKKYVIMEDLCGGCTNNKATGQYHIDIWMNSDARNAEQLLQCENAWTRRAEQIEVNPPSNRPVDTTPLFNPSTGSCLAQ